MFKKPKPENSFPVSAFLQIYINGAAITPRPLPEHAAETAAIARSRAAVGSAEAAGCVGCGREDEKIFHLLCGKVAQNRFFLPLQQNQELEKREKYKHSA